MGLSGHYTRRVLLEIPARSLVLLIGASGSGKSTFARKHFRPTQVISSDYCRALVSDDENDQGVSKDAFEILHLIAGKRLRLGRFTVIDATNVQPEARRSLLALAVEYEVPAGAIVFDMPVDHCLRQNQSRGRRLVDEEIIRMQAANLRASLGGLREEGFAWIHMLRTAEETRHAAVSVG